jgi:hypothetical protein
VFLRVYGLAPDKQASRSGALKSSPEALLNSVTVNGASLLDRAAPINGTSEYEAKQSWLQPLALHVVCEPSGGRSITFFHHLHGLTRTRFAFAHNSAISRKFMGASKGNSHFPVSSSP